MLSYFESFHSWRLAPLALGYLDLPHLLMVFVGFALSVLEWCSSIYSSCLFSFCELHGSF